MGQFTARYIYSSELQLPCDWGGRPPRHGGAMSFLGPGDPDHLDAVSGYFVRAGQILRALTRQLFAYPASGDLSDPRTAFTPAPDVAAEVPTVANGGLSPDRTVYTIRLRPGVPLGLRSPPAGHRRRLRPRPEKPASPTPSPAPAPCTTSPAPSSAFASSATTTTAPSAMPPPRRPTWRGSRPSTTSPGAGPRRPHAGGDPAGRPTTS